MEPQENPYASPELDAGPPTSEKETASEAEQIRRKFLNHEVTIRAFGILFYLRAVLTLLIVGAVFVHLAEIIEKNGPQVLNWWGIGLDGFLIVLAILLIFLGHGMRMLSPWVSFPVAVYAVIDILLAVMNQADLPAAAIGALFIDFSAIYLVLSGKGRVVLSPQYAEIRRQTPHVRYRSSSLVNIAAGVILVLFLLGVIGAIAGGIANSGKGH